MFSQNESFRFLARDWRVLRYRPAFLTGLIVLIASLFFLFAASKLMPIVAASVHSDNLYIASLYRDIFIDKISIQHWNFPPSPSFFPDMPLFFLLRAITGNGVIAICAYAFVELLVGVAMTASLVLQLGVVERWRASVAGLLGMGALGLFCSTHPCFAAVFFPSAHASCVWVGFGCLLLIGRQIQRNQLSGWSLIAILMLSALTAASDKLYLLQVTLSLGLTLCCLFLVMKKGRVIPAANAAALGLSGVLAQGILWIYQTIGMKLPTSSHSYSTPWDTLTHSLKVITVTHSFLSPMKFSAIEPLQLFGLGILIFTFVITFAVASTPFTGITHVEEPNRNIIFVATAFVAVTIISFAGVMTATGAMSDGWCIRYLWPLVTMPYVVVSVWLVLSRRNQLGRLAITACFVILFYVVGGWSAIRQSLLATLAEPLPSYPRAVACADEVARRYNARYGYGDYWTARLTTELSRTGVKILPTFAPFNTWDWLANPEWFSRVTEIHSPFLVLTDKIDPNNIRNKLGDPAHIELCYEKEVWVYPDPPRSRP
jgi:hypothetical protein